MTSKCHFYLNKASKYYQLQCRKKSLDAVGKFSAYKFIKRFWAHFLDLCVQKRRNLLWSSDAFSKFSPCKLCEKFWGHIIDFCVQKWSCLLFTSDVILKFPPHEVYEKSSGRIFTIHASRNEAVCCVVRNHFRSSPLARFTEKVLGAYLRFMCPKTKLFAVEFRRILEGFFLLDYWKISGRIFKICVSRKQHSWHKHFVKMFWARYVLQFCAPINFSVLLGHTEKFLTFTFYKNALNLNTFGLRVHPQSVTGGCDFMRSTFKQVLDRHLRHVL